MDSFNLYHEKGVSTDNIYVDIDIVTRIPRFIDRFRLPTRYVFALWAFLGFVMIYILRINLSMAIITMVNHTAINVEVNVTPECHSVKTNETKSVGGKFVWNEKLQGIILGSFFWGFLPFQIPGGWFADKVGGKWLFGVGILGTSVLTLFTPLAAERHYGCLIAIRVLEGVFESVTNPAIQAMLGLWSPKTEVSFMSSIVHSGISAGTVTGLVISGLLIEHHVMGGWPSVFYIPGIFGIAWFIVWSFVAYSSPNDHPRISEEEKQIINSPNPESRHIVPWKKILVSKPVYAIIFANFSTLWIFYISTTSLPGYFKRIIGFDIISFYIFLSLYWGGFMSSLPHVLYAVFYILCGKGADLIRSSKVCSVTTIRKVFTSVGLSVGAIILMFISYVGCNKGVIVSLFCLASVFPSFTAGGHNMNHLDLAPKFAGVLAGLSNTVSTLAGMIGPHLVGVIINHNDTKEQWKIVFFLSGSISLLGALFYAIFASGEKEPWAEDEIN